MKTSITFVALFLVPALCIMPHSILAQESGSTISGLVSHGGFGGPVVKLTSVNGELGVFAGGRGGWIINFRPDHTFVVEGGGYSLVSEIGIADIVSAGESVRLSLAYGGIDLEYVNRTRNPVHFAVNTLIGSGAADYGDDEDGDTFFVIEPGANVVVNITEFLRIGAVSVAASLAAQVWTE